MEIEIVLPNLLQIAEGLCWPIALYLFFRFSILLYQRRLIIRDSDKSLGTLISEFLNSGKAGKICLLKGSVTCGDSLVAPFTEKPCIAWKASLAAQYDTRVRDSATDSYAITMATEDLGHKSRQLDFILSDGTAELLCKASEASFQYQVFRSGKIDVAEVSKPSVSLAGFASQVLHLRDVMQITAWLCVEEGVPLGGWVSVMGLLRNTPDGLRVTAPPRPFPFLVSVHSPEKWLRGISIQALMFFLGSLFFMITGVLINVQG